MVSSAVLHHGRGLLSSFSVTASPRGMRSTITILRSSCSRIVAAFAHPTSTSIRSLAFDAVTKSYSSATPLNLSPGIRQLASSHADRLAVQDPDGQTYTYRDLFLSATHIASLYKEALVKSRSEKSSHNDVSVGSTAQDGPRVAILARPGAEFVAALWAAWAVGGVAVPLCVSHPPAELQYVLEDSGASLVVGPSDSSDLLLPLANRASVPFLPFPSPPESPQAPLSPSALLSPLAPDGWMEARGQSGALIIYTSGTTGRPKGVLHTHAGLASQAAMLVQAWQYSPSDRFLHVLPLHHVHGVMNALLAPLSAGAAVEFLPKFSPSAVWQRWRLSFPSNAPPSASAVTVFTGVPTHYVRLLQAYEAMAEDGRREAARAAASLRLMFAMALANPLHGERRPGCVGFPLPGIRTKIGDLRVDEAGGADLKVTDQGGARELAGELLIKSPGLFREYWNRPNATAEAFDGDGYFKTGDTVTVEEGGYFKILGRTSVDIIKSGGYKLSALEIEAKLLEHPKIAEIAVLGVPDADYGEAVAAVIVQAASNGESDSTELTMRELKKWAMERMAHYKIPTKLRVIDSMPRNAMGKVNKKDLRKSLFPTAP